MDVSRISGIPPTPFLIITGVGGFGQTDSSAEIPPLETLLISTKWGTLDLHRGPGYHTTAGEIYRGIRDNLEKYPGDWGVFRIPRISPISRIPV